MSPPTASEQIRFLERFQRILQEGRFTASYKFALLHVLADLCVERGDDSGDALELSTAELAKGFIQLYWRQTAPFPGGAADVLRQNTGRPAAVVRRVKEARASYGGSLKTFQEQRGEWSSLLRVVERTVREMPLWRLQTVGDEVDDFLYENRGEGRSITLRPGVAYCFRAFYPMLKDMLESAWAQFVRSQNRELLGAQADLRAFLFGTDRAVLTRFQPILVELQDGRCFYCAGSLRGAHEIDHFIPWSRYPIDLGHNFVLAHWGCNNSKRDRLAAESHLERWHERNVLHAAELEDRFDDAGAIHDLGATVHVARWAYAQAQRSGGHGWVSADVLEPISGVWERILEESAG